MLVRLIATGLQTWLRPPVVVENRGGANGAIGMRTTAQVSADGYTLVVGPSSEVAASRGWP